MSSLREAMMRADEIDASEAISRALTVENNFEGEAESRITRIQEAEIERQAREDEFASWAMEIIVRARQRIGRTKWSSAEGQAKRRIVEALRCLAPDE